jgi:hypothetical protein
LAPLKQILRRITARRLIILLAVYSMLTLGLISLAVLSSEAPAHEKAVIKMALGLNLIWVIVLGSTMFALRDRIRSLVRAVPLPWGLKFFLFCAGLALLEEAVTVSMTNLAPLFGARVGEAFITASANYLHTVLFHSVIVFLPMFAVWVVLLRYFTFKPAQVFLLFGLTGSLAEMSMSPTNVLAGFWFFVYGLMIYLPAYSLPEQRGARRPPWWAYPLAAFGPLLSPILLLPFTPLLRWLWQIMDPEFFVESIWD